MALKSYNIAVIGATGIVGETLIHLLESRKFPVNKLYPIASQRSINETILFNKQSIPIQAIEEFDFKQVHLAFFSAGSQVSKEYVPIATKNNCISIDNTSYFRYEKNIPLIIPEININDLHLDQYKKSKIIANPNCSTIQMLMALYPIHQVNKIKKINVSTYQSVSGAGRQGIKELASHTANALNGIQSTPHHFLQPIAFNVIPHIDQFESNGYTKEEMKMLWETQKILHDNLIHVNATCVRVPVFFSHSEAIHIETSEKINIGKIKALLKKTPGVVVMDSCKNNEYPTPCVSTTDQDEVFVGRIRPDLSNDHNLNLWVVSDNIRKGAALNAIQIAEYLIKHSMLV